MGRAAYSDTPSSEPREFEPYGSPMEVRAYLSDMLGELASMAASIGDTGLEKGLRMLALEAASGPR